MLVSECFKRIQCWDEGLRGVGEVLHFLRLTTRTVFQTTSGFDSSDTLPGAISMYGEINIYF